MPYIKSHHQQQSHKLRQLIPAATTTTEKEEEELGIPLVVVVVLVPLFIFDGFQGLETGWETKGNPYRGKNSVWSQKLWGRLPRLRLSSLRQKKMDVWATLRKLWQNKLFGLEPMILQPIRLASHASLGLLLNDNPCPSTSSLCWGQRVIDIRVQEDRKVCHGVLVTYSIDVVIKDLKKFLSETQSEIIILEVRTYQALHSYLKFASRILYVSNNDIIGHFNNTTKYPSL